MSEGEILPPAGLPGAFYVLAYDRESQAFTLYVDDEQQSSYNLGELSAVIRYLGLFGGSVADLAINHAMQFGSVQVIPGQKRVISLHNRNCHVDPFAKANQDACYLPAL